MPIAERNIPALEARKTLDEAQQRRLASLVAMPDDRRAIGVTHTPAKVMAAALFLIGLFAADGNEAK